MAKQLHTQLTGRMDDYSFYRNRLHGYLVRRTGGVTSTQYHSDDRYAAARDASTEFAAVSKTGKLIRNALAEFIAPIKDGPMVNRLNKELVALKQLDNKHDRGKRTPETMLADPEANKWFRIFQFNDQVKLYDLLEHYPTGNTVYRVPALRPEAFPESARYAGLTLVKTIIDFEKGIFETISSEMVLTVGAGASQKESQEGTAFEMKTIPLSEGIEITCLQVLFFREENGMRVQLKEQVHSMGVIDVRKRSVLHSPQTNRRQVNKRRKRTFRASMPFNPRQRDTEVPSIPGILPFIPPDLSRTSVISLQKKENRRGCSCLFLARA